MVKFSNPTCIFLKSKSLSLFENNVTKNESIKRKIIEYVNISPLFLIALKIKSEYGGISVFK